MLPHLLYLMKDPYASPHLLYFFLIVNRVPDRGSYKSFVVRRSGTSRTTQGVPS